ncbi:hypothetical protein HDU93_001323 [Gonapodya sp. JEL0774]|nr:hypothetical protein HDU93_001323 [Gonapodya sp. JEL0774]
MSQGPIQSLWPLLNPVAVSVHLAAFSSGMLVHPGGLSGSVAIPSKVTKGVRQRKVRHNIAMQLA